MTIIQIRDKRIAKQLTQAQLAERIGVSQPCVAQWETGKTVPETTLLPRLAFCLDCSIDDLFSPEVWQC